MKVTTKPPRKNTTATTTRAPTSRTSTSSKGPDRSLLTLPVSDIARTGIAGGISKLPFLERIQASFGPAHDLSTVSAHVDDRAANASRALGARAYALGDHVAFAKTPTLHLAAHEAAHVVQQRGTRAGDDERLARMVADRVIGGRAAEDLLPSPLRSRVGHPLVQRDVDPLSAAELRDDAGHVATETPSSVLHRKPATKPAASETKPQIIAIEAVMDAKQGTAALSDRTTVPLTLSKNDFPPGTRVLNHESNGKYAGAAPIIDPKNPKRSTWAFVWINPYLPGTKEVSYAWAPSVTVTIRLTAEQRIGRLPAYIRNALTTDKGEKAGADEIEEVAHAGELLEQAGVTAQDMILYDEQIKAARASGATISQVDAFDFAQSMVGVRAQKQLQSVQQFDDVITISKLLADEPLYTIGHGGLGPTLDPDSDKIELSVAFGIYKAYAQQGRAGDLGTLDTAGKRKYLHELVVGFRTLLRRFEQALLVDLRALADTALDAAEASILLMDKRFTGIWQEIVPGPGLLHDEIDRINRSEPIVRATDQRVEDNAAIDRETFIDKKKLHQEYFGPSLKAVADYAEREEQRDERRKQVEAAFEEAVRKSSDLKLPPGKSARQILEAHNSDSAVTLLRDYLYDGRSKIRAARSKISEDKVLYAAEIWIHAEQEHLKAALGAELGGEIAVLIDRFASLRKSQTSIWEDLLRIIEFVSMFVPGPIGWGLRAGTAILSANEELSQQYTQSAIYGAGGSNVKPSSPTLVAVNAVVNMIPDAGMVTKGAGAGERLATQGLERAGGGAADDAAKLAKQALDDTAQAGGHAATGGAETAAKTEVGERVATEGAEPTVKTEERAAAASGGEHTQAAAHGDAPKPEATAPADDEVLVGIRGEDEVQPLSLDEVRGRRDDLTRDKAQLELAAGRKQEEIDRLRENVVARKAEMKNPRRLKAEDRIEELERELAKQHVEIAEVDRTLSEAQSDLHKLEGPKPPAPAPAPLAAARPPEPLGELAIPQQPLTLGGTGMQSWSDRVYIATSREGYRPNVEKLLLKDPEGPLSKALLLDKPGGGKMIRAYSSPTKEVAEANRDLFVAGHFKSAKTGDRDVIVLTSAHRNMEFASDLETAGAHERMGDFVYVVQGIAVEPGTAWDLVRSTKLDAAVRARLEQELTEANKLWLAR